MMELIDATDEEIDAELSRRRCASEPAKPEPLKEINWDPVKLLAENYIRDMDRGFDDDEYPYHLESAVMKAVFGPDVYVWINKRAR